MPNIMPTPPAYQGFTGFAEIDASGCPAVVGGPFGLRLTSSDLKLKQAVEPVDVISGKYDKVVWKIGPKEIDGGISFPAIMEDLSTGNPISNTWRLAVLRSAYATAGEPSIGRLYGFDVNLKYYAGGGSMAPATFIFGDSVINTWEWSVTQGEQVTINLNVYSKSRTPTTIDEPNYRQRNVRAVTWADCDITIGTGDGGPNPTGFINTPWFRGFTFNLNNNVERFYVVGNLNPQDIVAKQRDITGQMTIMGRHSMLGDLAMNNQNVCFANNFVNFGYSLQVGACNAIWHLNLPGAVFQIEEMGMQLGLVESTVSYRIMPGEVFNSETADTFEV